MSEITLKGALELGRGAHLKLDLIDKKIIAILGENARATHLFISKLVGLSKGSVRYRIERMKHLDLLRATMTLINPYKLGFSFYTIFLRLDNIDDKKELEIMQYFALHPYTAWTGICFNWDIGLHLFACNEYHFQEIIKEIEQKCEHFLKEIQIIPIVAILSYRNIPADFFKEFRSKIEFTKRDISFGSLIKRKKIEKTDVTVKLDKLDILIIKKLSQNATVQFSDIAKEARVTIDTVKNRIERLIKEDVILSFSPLFNISYLGLQPYVIFIKLRPNARIEPLENYFKDNIQFALKTYGIWDYTLWIALENELQFFYFLRDLRNKFQDAIASFDTISVIKDFKFTFTPEGFLSDISK